MYPGPASDVLDSDDGVNAGLDVFHLSAEVCINFWRFLHRFWLVFADFL